MTLAKQLTQNISQSDPFHFYKNGFQAREVARFWDFDNNDVSKIADVSKKSVRYDKNIPAGVKQHLEQIANIASKVGEFFDGNPELTALWLRTPNPMLGGMTPRDMVRFGRYKKLLSIITQALEENEPSGS